MATETRPGFRLPGTAAAGEAEDQPATADAPVPEESQESDMIETTDSAETTDTAEPPAEPEPGGSQPARRATKFMADLSRAMQAAAETARSETMTRFEVDAKGVVEQIHAKATEEAADLRRKVDDEVAAIRDWSKTEIARIREETEERIAARKSGLDAEVERHTATVEARVERVAVVVASFEAQMASFFERMNAEEDPTRIATMAEAMPDPPSLADVVASIAHVPAPSALPLITPLATAPDEEASTEIDFAAAEAEAASFSGDQESEDDESATAVSEPVESPPVEDSAPSLEQEPTASPELASTHVIVSGLVSVANIANFKRSLTRTPGISAIAVASGPDGAFVFTVGHTLGSTLSASVQAMPGFDIQITGESDDAINVAAQDRDAGD